MRRLLPLTAALLLSACASLPSSQPPQSVQAALDKAGLTSEQLGVVAFPLDARGSGLRIQADRPMQPGSAMKLITAAVSLDKLGPNARAQTELLADAPAISGMQDGALAGPLYLRGGADPDLGWGALHTMLRELRDQGVREIRGGLVVDRNLFNPARRDIGAPPFDEQPEFPYNVIPDALMFNGNLLEFVLESDATTLHARATPALPGVTVDVGDIKLADTPCKDWENGWQIPSTEALTVHLHGQFPRNCKVRQELNVIDRQWLATQALRMMWRELGGTITGPDTEGTTPATARVLATHRGRPLAEELRGVLKESDNALTRLAFLQLGASEAQPGEATAAVADRLVRQWFASKNIPTEGLVLENGSGLSRSERVTATQLAGLLAASHDGLHGPELLSTLPVAGVDGTLSHRMKGTPAEGLARMKTGTLNNAIGLAGYVPDASGRLWVVAAMVNAPQAGRGRPVLDAVALWVRAQRP
ncbi:MAG: D-alanyl-D-alanine carboxypeptidase/D-alanyl-D-alanine-endopeptidase [Paucibacter sp.]|nr:D-alanyl-D-alanine carboxypeptidase/D-alanyl-D-alanine-endopeptidase [Roseateles sp.]